MRYHYKLSRYLSNVFEVKDISQHLRDISLKRINGTINGTTVYHNFLNLY